MSLRQNTLWNLAGAGTPLLVALVSIPYLLRSLGPEGFGVLTLIWALIGYFSLFDFGMGRALTYELGRRAERPYSELAPYLRAGLLLSLMSGICGAVVVVVLTKPMTDNWLGISSSWKSDATKAFLVAAVGIIPTTLTSGLRGALEGLNRFAASNLNKLALGALMFALPAWSIAFHGRVMWIATIYIVAARLIFTLIAIIQLRTILSTAGRIEAHHISALFKYGIWISISSIIGPLMIYGDRFFVSAAVGAEMLPQYAIPQEGLQRLLLIPVALTSALLPILATLQLRQVEVEYKIIFRKVALGMFLVCSVAAALSYPLLSIWISPQFAGSAVMVCLILAIGIWFNSMAMVPYTVIHALGKPRITALFHITEIFLYIAILWVFTMYFGIVGAAIAWTGRVIVDFILMYATANQMLKSH